MSPGEQPDEDALDHVRLADDDLADLVQQGVDEGALFGDQLVQGAYVVHNGWELIASPAARGQPAPIEYSSARGGAAAR